MKCTSDPFECTCECHTMPGVCHIVPCCTACPYCDKNLEFSADKHIQECKARKEEAERIAALPLNLKKLA